MKILLLLIGAVVVIFAGFLILGAVMAYIAFYISAFLVLGAGFFGYIIVSAITDSYMAAAAAGVGCGLMALLAILHKMSGKSD